MTRVLIVDDHQGIRLGLSAMLSCEPDLEVCGVASTGEAALEVAGTTEPDVVVMDLSMPGMGGIAATRALVASRPGLHVLVLSWHADAAQVRDALDAGATGYLLKGDSEADLVDTVRAVALGEPRMSRQVRDL